MIKYLMTLLFASLAFANVQNNPVGSRLQWMANGGYCGETCMIAAGLYYGQYMSQYDMRALVSKDQVSGALLLGVNDKKAAKEMHLQYEAWDTDSEQNTDQFLIWVKQKVVSGNPVAMGVYANQYLLYHATDPNAGDPDYDHIVSATTLMSNHPLNDPTYYGDDQVGFSDNGLWDNQSTPIYYFAYPFDPFQMTRQQANSPNGPDYSLANDGSNYGIAITGVADLNGDTLPVSIDTNFNYEAPSIDHHSNTRPPAMPITLTITISNLEPHVPYILYRYSKLDAVPESEFNAHAGQADQKTPVQIGSGATYTLTAQIQSSDIAVYRCVKASAP